MNRLYIPKCKGGKGLMIIQDCVNDKNESFALHIGTSNGKFIKTVTAELNLEKFINN